MGSGEKDRRRDQMQAYCTRRAPVKNQRASRPVVYLAAARAGRSTTLRLDGHRMCWESDLEWQRDRLIRQELTRPLPARRRVWTTPGASRERAALPPRPRNHPHARQRLRHRLRARARAHKALRRALPCRRRIRRSRPFRAHLPRPGARPRQAAGTCRGGRWWCWSWPWRGSRS